MSSEDSNSSVDSWRLLLLFWIAIGVLIGICGFLFVVGLIFGKNVAIVLMFLALVALVILGHVGDTFSPAQPEVALPSNVTLRQPLELRNGRYETRIEFDGETWRATLPDDGLPPPSVGEIVSVAGRDGVEIHLEREG